MKISLVIPAKGTSTRVHNKNLHKINGKTLVERACEKALECKNIDRVYLDTESEKIILHVEHLFKDGLNLIRRPKELADNDTGANEMLVYAMHTIEDCDLIVQTFSTSPTITSETIDRAIDQFVNEGDKYDSFFTVMPMQEYFWDENGAAVNFDTQQLPNSFQLPQMFMETHGLYGIYTKALIKCKTRVGERPMLIPISKKESFDIDDLDDLDIVKRMVGNE